MSRLTNQQVDAIAQQLLRGMSAGATARALVDPPSSDDGQRPSLGVFNDLNAAVKAARAAYEALDGLPLAKRDEIIANIRQCTLRESESLAFAAHSETGLGRYEDKIIKNRLVSNKTPGTEVLVAEVKTGDGGLSLFERAPFGVIGSITPLHESNRDDYQQHHLHGGRGKLRRIQRSSHGQGVLDSLC